MSSSIKINRDTVNKLTHESVEIRLRTLEQLSSKIKRSLALNESIEFRPSDLCKQLIRWFGFMPLQQPLKVLNLLKSIIESPKYGCKAIDKLGPERFVKELRKIQTLFDDRSPEYNIIIKMKDFLKSIHTQLDMKNEVEKMEALEDVIKSARNLKIDGETTEYFNKEYEIPWSRPSASDYSSMKFLADILVNKFATTVEIENAVQHLQLSMEDYPAEYLLQPPHIFRNLLKIYDERKNNDDQHILLDGVAATLLQFLKILEKRIKMLGKSKCFHQREIDTQTSPCQLKFDKALAEILEASVFHLEIHSSQGNVLPVVWEVIFKVLQLIEELERKVEDPCLYKVASIVADLSVKFADAEHCARIRLHQMLLIFLLQDVAQVNTKINTLIAVEVFESILRDCTMKKFFNTRHQLVEILVLNADKCLNEKYQLLKLYEGSFELSIQVLINRKNWSCDEIIKKGHSVCTVLDMLQSKQLIDILFDGVIEAIPLCRANDILKGEAIDLLLKLLNLTFLPLKMYAYDKLSTAFKRHLGCLMTGERYVMESSNSDLLKAHIVGVPLNTDLLLQFVHESFESSCEKIKSSCNKILELLLQSQSLFGANWFDLLTIVIPLLPLLNCCCLSEKMMDLLLKLYDPDLGQLPYVRVLQGNIALLFHSNAGRRSEALTRLIYTLNSLKGAEKYLPNLMEISDTLPNDICLENTAREYRHIFSDRLPVRADVLSTLDNLLHLLDSPDVEPLIRKTTLMQINVLCGNWQITGELCSIGASYLILQALENALQKSCALDYSDAAVPAISILNKVLLYDSSVRCELAESANIYMLLLRALMMFHHNIQLRQDAIMCLIQLLFSAQLISTANSVEGPLILGNIRLPLDINLRSALSNKIQHETEKLSAMFATALEETQYWRMVIASTYFGGSLMNITQKSLPLIAQLDVREDLKLCSQDVRFIRATQPGLSLHRLLKAALNATDHRSLIQAFHLMKQQLMVPLLKNTFSVNDEFCLQLNSILSRYLQMPPGNNNDLTLYEHLLDVITICLKIPLPLMGLELFKVLVKDSRHALVTMIIQTEEIPLRIYNKITTLLRLLLKDHKHTFKTYFNASNSTTFYSNLFDLFMERCLQLFEIRNLQRVRCLLSLLVNISCCQLDMPDQLLFFYCRRFAQLSLALKSFTQTGAQWHRDCFLSILQLSNQMQEPAINFRLNAGFVKYLSGLCGHNDMEVRTLAWSILNVTAKTKAIDSSENEQKRCNISGTELLLNELSYLPGGFMACCLCTLLDVKEAICVRHLAGQLMATLIRSQKQMEDIEKLVEQHNFISLATKALTSDVYILEMKIPRNLDTFTLNATTCDLISCYTLICIEISIRSPAFLNDICTRTLMFKLYEILKQPSPISKHIGYINMIAHICRLYTLCYSSNFVFLQRTLCRDAVWLSSFCQILFGIVAPSEEVYSILNMLQLFLVLCKDSTALEQLSVILLDYSTDIVRVFQDALVVKNLNTSLQGCTLSILSLLLIKTQSEIDKDLSINILTLLERQNVSTNSLPRCNEHFENDNKENKAEFEKEKANRGKNENFTLEKANKDKNLKIGKDKDSVSAKENRKTSISEYICISLTRLLTHLYPIKVCKFSTPPNSNQQHVIETLAILLKQSQVGQETAQNLKLQNKIVKIFKNFFDEFATTSCTTYVKRNGENKKVAVIKNLQLLLKLLLSWYSSPAMMVADNVLAMDYSKILIQIWPWLAHSNDLKLTVLRVCAFLSERSLIVCKQFSTLNNSSFPHSVLQLVAKMMTAETLKIKANSIDCSQHISAGLRVLINCCSSVEGRTAINKIHVLDIFDGLHPFNPKAPQLKLDIVIAWLDFWELFSRYDEGAQPHHLNALCSVVNKSSPGCAKRLTSLRILRNMAFLSSNRSTLITSTDFIYTVSEIVSQPIKNTVEEQFVMCVALWKLISGGIKFVSMIRGTKLAKHLLLIKENLTCAEDEYVKTIEYSNDLLNVLNIIFKIFNN